MESDRVKVELIAYTPNPDAVCNVAAGTCVSEDIPNMEMSVNKYRALKGALASGHESVAEHANFTFAISGVSRACLAQLSRHRLMSLSVQSQRYVQLDDFEYGIPKSIQDDEGARDVFINCMTCINDIYCSLIEDYHIPAEDARAVLPNACKTNIVLTANARELRHIFALRCCTRAQGEIRELANRMLELVEEVAPTIFEDAGASCVQTGRCPEGAKSCGKVKKSQDVSD